jgi:hypothetical protein
MSAFYHTKQASRLSGDTPRKKISTRFINNLQNQTARF